MSSELFFSALCALRDPVFIADTAGKCRFANPSFLAFFELSSKPGEEFSVSEFWPGCHSSLTNQGEITAEFVSPNSGAFAVKLSVQPLDGHCTLYRVLAGAPKNQAFTNFHAQRLETLGMLAGGVAHDFNNVLAGILGHITYLKTILPARGPHVESLRAIEDGAKKASSITAQILNFSKLNVAEEMTPVDLGELVTRTCSLLRGAISPEFKVEPHIPATRLKVLAVDGKLAQVIVNLVINARDALQPGGRIQLTVAECTDMARLKRVFQADDLACPRYVALSVKDNGHGMEPDVMARMFEPYFSTKKERGTGLGLPTVNAIVKQFGGAIDVQSTVNVGTEISIFLPLVESTEEASAPRQAPEPREQLPRGTERVLIVDDEDPVRNVLAVSLQHLGYEVLSASSGSEALQILQEKGGGIDLVILDMLMPHLSGDKVFFRMRESHPSIRVLLISGFASEDAVKSVLSQGGLGFIQKPFTIEELAKQVRRCLEISR